MAYVLQQRLGRGGMGVVDLARAPDGTLVAIKRLVLSGSAQEMDQARQRIRREAQVLRQLDHPHIVRLLDVYDDGDHVTLVMPYLSGGNLADQVRAHGPLNPYHVARLAPPLLAALASAHNHGIVHRDVKPANVLFDERGEPYLADFGVALLQDATSGLTATGSILGTPEFMAPEQARGEPATPASDVFALGATLAFAATGASPYGRGDPWALVQRAARARVQPLPNHLPREVHRLLAPMLDKNPRRRPTAMVAEDLASRTQVLRRFLHPRPRTRAVLLGCAILALVSVIAVLTLQSRQATGPLAGANPTSQSTASVVPVSTAAPCTDQPYRPCGKPNAPFTDGLHCIESHGDYDGDPDNGCEAAPDTVDGQPLDDKISANLVPETDVDGYPFHLTDRFSLRCNGAVRVTLTPPKDAVMTLEVVRGKTTLGTATSNDGKAVTLTINERCLDDDSGDYLARVSWAPGAKHSASSYKLERSGSF